MKIISFAAFILLVSLKLAGYEKTNQAEYDRTVRPFLTKYCINCHDEDVQKGKFALHDIDGLVTNGKDAVRWLKTLEMLSLEEMPPPNKKQPLEADRLRIIDWLEQELRKIGKGPDDYVLKMPKNGNRVKHSDLFSGKYNSPSFSPARIWRINPWIYDEFIKRFRPLLNGQSQREISQPFAEISGAGLKDYDILTANEGTLKVLLQTSYRLAGFMTYGVPHVTGKRKGKIKEAPKVVFHRPDIKSFIHFNGFALNKPFRGRIADEEKVMDLVFQELLQRKMSSADKIKYLPLLKKNIAQGGKAEGLRYTIMAVMMSPEFIFRMEHGWGKKTEDGRRMLSGREILYSIGYTLTDKKPDEEMLLALEGGKLNSKADVEREVRRLLSQPAGKNYWGYLPDSTGDSLRKSAVFNPDANLKILRFFREFFGYTEAINVFKDEERNRSHQPARIIHDADLFILHNLKKDKNILKNLLTSPDYFVAYTSEESFRKNLAVLRKGLSGKSASKKKKKQQYILDQFSKKRNPIVINSARDYISTYNLEKDWDYQVVQPFAFPSDQRAGMLTHPAWLVAHSSNFENDPVKRGKWIQERLLSGVVPDVPIGVDAKVPEDHTKTLRQRFEIVSKEECWRCHRKMNPLGNVFEAYDDFGRYRVREPLEDPAKFASKLEAFERKFKKTKSREQREKMKRPVLKTLPVDSSTELIAMKDPALNGKYDNAIELVRKLSGSKLVRQSFIRHIFRYFMGRNESLIDSPTLMAMDRAYVRSGGSFKETLITLITSDSFLYRR